MFNKRILLGIIPLLVVFWFIYNSKRSDYNNGVNFYGNGINGIIYKIKRTRGTKVYYGNKEDYFYLEDYEGISLKKGDSINKLDQHIRVYRKSANDSDYKLIGKGTPIKPKKSYFAYFFS